MVYNQQILYAESGSYSEVEGQSSVSSEDDDDVTWVVLGPIIGAAATLVLVTLVTFLTIYCYYSHRNRKRDRKSTKVPANDFFVVNAQLLAVMYNRGCSYQTSYMQQ